jgi:HPt (histidine-containing phosphotransfer) domain-containing protein
VSGSSETGQTTTNALDLSVIESLRELCGSDEPGLVLEIIGIFLEDAPARIREIEMAFATNDVKLLERASHSLKSASANVGAVQLSGVCRRLEELARINSAEGLADLVPESRRAWERAAAALRVIEA